MGPLILMPGPQAVPFLSMLLNSIYKGNTGNLWARWELKLHLLNLSLVVLLQGYPCTSFSMHTFNLISPTLLLRLLGTSIILHQRLPIAARTAFTDV